MRWFILLSGLTFWSMNQSAYARDLVFQSQKTQTSLLELFSSEGCSSCPPAEQWISHWQDSVQLWTQVVPVVFHVDYWDHLGWPDRFASPAYTARQRNYSAKWASSSVYTPGFVIDGKEWRGWFSGQSLPQPGPAEIGVLTVNVVNEKEAKISFQTNRPSAASYRVELALLGHHLASDVKRGENGGRKLLHDFVVLNLSQTALTKSESGENLAGTIALPTHLVEKPSALAVWVEDESGLPVQATGGWL